LGRFAVGPDSELAQGSEIAYKTINARVETIDTAPSYRQAFGKRRCLIPADGFFKWKKVPGGRIPCLIGMKDDSPFVFAGLWEGWKVPENGQWLHTRTIISGEPNEFVREIHTRMPVILPKEHHDSWLSGGLRTGRGVGDGARDYCAPRRRQSQHPVVFCLHFARHSCLSWKGGSFPIAPQW
jgi:putative SOS response-associated peptidase YedK